MNTDSRKVGTRELIIILISLNIIQLRFTLGN